ncbi:hypothetical protein [Pseudomonas chlororaphis]|uniref:hypothetical protein n=1 Tax=Pseudomonas chlororaphis TaxID=587753 RepID=UPI000A119CBD|nr:hypothetical protein [Pseudomonas chlororaphis]MBM0285054.1 hypothetical protein [Pseudomonas chlororaphis]MDO1505727.1 hypothetical protein [Pseudomonas chlororaphis]ORM49807.1 hypothetical protein B6D51_01310 [Pseudomonas chlororaphis subsp. chlororaphis]TWR99085.1 hypothetical protein FJD36_03725 [Pseudomonas chlororaphis subsp. chlororaphis]WDG99746.1 hypothetical protein PUP54_09310 [Pseudomonas chlororaphis]
MKAFLKILGVLSAAALTASCQSGPPPAPKTEAPTQAVVLDNWFKVRFCADGSNTIDGKLIQGRLCSQTQKYEVAGGPVIKLAGQHGYVGSLSPQEAVKGFSVKGDGITYTLKCELLPNTGADSGETYRCAYDANNLPLVRVNITYP